METANNNKNLQSRVEALLFIYGESMPYKKIAKILGFSEEEIKESVKVLSGELSRENRGLAIVSDKDKIQLVTKPEFGKLIEDVIKGEVSETLTTAALETLAIIAYTGPITRAEIEYIRGVNSTFMLRNLLIRGLIERVSDLKRGNVYLYKPSFELLKFIGISKVEDLPEYQKFYDLVRKIREQPEEQKNNNLTPNENQSS